jgi:hypothetical protein
MALQVVHARVVLPDGNTFEDTASIGFTFEAVSATAIAPADVQTVISNYFNLRVGAMVDPLASYMSPEISRAANGCSIEIYDVTDHLDGTPSGSPLSIQTFTMAASGSSSPLPAQLAAVIAYRAAYGADLERGTTETVKSTDSAIDQGAPATHTGISRPRASDRGRIYLGPLNLTTLKALVAPAAGTAGVLSDQFMSDALIWATDNLGTHAGIAGGAFSNVVWSRARAAVKLIGWIAVDAAVGVIRKRADTVINRVLTWTPEGA